MAREVGAAFTCPCLGHCETWLIHQKLTTCRSHLLSHAIHVCKRTKWRLQKAASGLTEINSGLQILALYKEEGMPNFAEIKQFFST